MSQDDWRRQLDESIERFKNRRTYQLFDVVTLGAIPDEEVEQALFDYASDVIWEGDVPSLDNFRSLPVGIQALYATWMVDSEVNNGGFNQYFWNSFGVFADDAIDGFSFFGATELADLMRQAIDIARVEAGRRNWFKRINTLEAFSDSYKHTKLGALDKRYYTLAAELSALRIRVIRGRPEQFVTGPKSLQ